MRHLVGWLGIVGLVACTQAAPERTEDLPLTPEPTEQAEQVAEELDEYIHNLGHLAVDEAHPKREKPCDAGCPTDGQEGDAFCTYTKYEETARFDRFVAFQPNSATLWPGSVVRGADAQHGLLTPVGAPLAPVTFSASLENYVGSPAGTMDTPSLSSFREERNRILAGEVDGSTLATLDFTIHEIHDASQLSIALGASVDWPGGNDIAASFDFDSQQQRTKMVVDFTQAYYTIDVDTPANPSDFFAPGTSVDQVAAYVGQDSPPVYVQSITYGRRVIFTVESTRSREEIEAALSATYQTAASASIDLETSYVQTLEESEIHAFVYGGSAADATAVIDGVEGLMSYIKRGGDYGKDSPGAPIAYKLAYLDNAVTEMAFTTEYAERQCLKNRGRLVAELERIDHVGGGDLGGNVELYGYVAVRVPVGENRVESCAEGGEVVALWDLYADQWISFDKYGSWTPSSELSIDIEDVAMGSEQKLCIGTHIWESDNYSGELSADEDFGYDDRLITWDAGWNGSHVLQPRGSGENGADVTVRLTVEN